MARGHIRKQGERSYLVAVPIPGMTTDSGYQKYHYETIKAAPGMTLTELRKAAEDRCAALVRLYYRDEIVETPTKITMRQYLTGWIERRKRESLRARTILGYEQHIKNHLIPYFGDMFLSKLSADNIRAYLVYAASRGRSENASIKTGAGLSPRSVHAHFRTLRAALRDALEDGLITRNPLAGVSAPRLPKRQYKTLSADEAKALLQYARDTDSLRYRLWLTLLLTGLRLGELLALRWRNIDFKKGLIYVRHSIDAGGEIGEVKTPESVSTIPMMDMLSKELKKHQEEQVSSNPLELVFPGKLGKPMSASIVYHWLQADLDGAELPKVRLHDLRHTCGTLLLELGVDLVIVSRILRHSNIQITADTYLHPHLDSKAAALQRLEEALKK